MDIQVPKPFLDNIELIIQYQNIRLISDICNYMKWNTQIKNMLIKKLVKT